MSSSTIECPVLFAVLLFTSCTVWVQTALDIVSHQFVYSYNLFCPPQRTEERGLVLFTTPHLLVVRKSVPLSSVITPSGQWKCCKTSALRWPRGIQRTQSREVEEDKEFPYYWPAPGSASKVKRYCSVRGFMDGWLVGWSNQTKADAWWCVNWILKVVLLSGRCLFQPLSVCYASFLSTAPPEPYRLRNRPLI